MSYVSLTNSTESKDLDYLHCVGDIDFTDAILIGFPVDDVTLEVANGHLKVKDSGISNVKIYDVDGSKIWNNSVTDDKLVNMNMSKLTGYSITFDDTSGYTFTQSQSTNTLRFESNYLGSILDLQPTRITAYKNLFPSGVVSLGDASNIWASLYASGMFSDQLTVNSIVFTALPATPILNLSGLAYITGATVVEGSIFRNYTLGVGPIIQYDLSDRIAVNSSDVTFYTDILPNITDTYNLGSAIKRFNAMYGVSASLSTSLTVPIITNPIGTEFQYNGFTKLTIANDGVIVSGITTTNTINNVTGVAIQYNGSTKLAITSTGVSVTGSLSASTSVISPILNNTSGVVVQYNGVSQFETMNGHVYIPNGISIGLTSLDPSLKLSVFGNIGCVTLTAVTSILTPLINSASGVSLQYNGSTKLLTTSSGLTLTGTVNCSDIDHAAGTNLKYGGSTKLATTSIGVTVIGTLNTAAVDYGGSMNIGNTTTGSRVYLKSGTGVADAVFVGDNAIKNKKLALYDNSGNENEFFGFGINSQTLRYQVGGNTHSHVFYAPTSSSASVELGRLNTTGFTVPTKLCVATTATTHTVNVTGTAGLSTGTLWTNTSDGRLKHDIKPLEYGLNDLLKLKPVRYKYKRGIIQELDDDHERVGLIAQDVQEIYPSCVTSCKHSDDNEYLTLNCNDILFSMINGFKELAEKLDTAIKRIAVLEDELDLPVSKRQRINVDSGIE